jgi:hypothetical protein
MFAMRTCGMLETRLLDLTIHSINFYLLVPISTSSCVFYDEFPSLLAWHLGGLVTSLAFKL